MTMIDLVPGGLGQRAVFVCDSEAKNIYTNSAYQSMTGTTPEELLGLGWISFVHPDDLPAVWAVAFGHFSGPVEGNRQMQCEYRLTHKYKKNYFTWVNVQSVDMSGCPGIGSFVGILEDISWKKEAEESLRRSEERYVLAVRGSNDGLWDWDIESNQVFYSQRYKNMVGLGPNETADNLGIFESRLHPKHREPVMKTMKDYLATNKADSPPFDVETLLQTGDGLYNWFRVRGQALWNKENKAVRMAGSITDITERRKWEEEQARLIANLAIARDKAEKSAKARSEFLAVMSHEIRTPLNGVIGMASVLLDTAPTPEQQECLETIRTSGECLLSIINDILDFSKIDAGKLTISSVQCNLRNMVEEVGSMLALRVEPKGVEMVVRYRPSLSAVFVDAGRLRQVLINLVGNACKFTHVGSIAVDVSLVCEVCDQELRTGELHCSHCKSNPSSEFLQKVVPTADANGLDAPLSNGSWDPGDPEPIFVHNPDSGQRRSRAVENIRAHMQLCESYKGLTIDKVSQTDIFAEGLGKSDLITQDSEVKLPVFANQNKRKRLYRRMEDHENVVCSNGDTSKPVEEAELCTPSYWCSEKTAEMNCDAATTSGSDRESDDEVGENAAENPRMLRWFRFSVIDTGIGIATDKLDSLFEKFTQCSTTTTSTYGGTGLGLAVSKRLVELMGGTIGVESSEGQGSKFTFTLPLELDSSSEEGDNPPTIYTPMDTSYGPSSSSSSSSPPHPHPHRVLVLDRHEMTKEALCDQIRAWGLDATPCTEAFEAISLLRQASTTPHPFRVAVVERSVVELFSHEMRKIPELHALQLVMLGRVGHSLPSQRMLEELGCCASFSRPPRQAYLRDALSAALSGGHKVVRMKPDFALDMVRRAPKNWRHAAAAATAASTFGGLSAQARRSRKSSLDLDSSSGSSRRGAVAGSPPPPPPPPSRLPPWDVHGRSPHILIVEDNKVNQMVAQRLFHNLGCSVDVACDGLEAIGILERPNAYDIIFMDCHMPVMDGFETARLVRQKSCISHAIPIVALTAATSEGEVEKCLASGMDDYISKPVTKGILHRSLQKWVGQESRWVDMDRTL